MVFCEGNSVERNSSCMQFTVQRMLTHCWSRQWYTSSSAPMFCQLFKSSYTFHHCHVYGVAIILCWPNILWSPPCHHLWISDLSESLMSTTTSILTSLLWHCVSYNLLLHDKKKNPSHSLSFIHIQTQWLAIIWHPISEKVISNINEITK